MEQRKRTGRAGDNPVQQCYASLIITENARAVLSQWILWRDKCRKRSAKNIHRLLLFETQMGQKYTSGEERSVRSLRDVYRSMGLIQEANVNESTGFTKHMWLRRADRISSLMARPRNARERAVSKVPRPSSSRTLRDKSRPCKTINLAIAPATPYLSPAF